jgi:hypothetical protein
MGRPSSFMIVFMLNYLAELLLAVRHVALGINRDEH